MALAMTVGATKIRVLQEKVMSSLSGTKPSETQIEHSEETTVDQEVCTV